MNRFQTVSLRMPASLLSRRHLSSEPRLLVCSTSVWFGEAGGWGSPLEICNGFFYSSILPFFKRSTYLMFRYPVVPACNCTVHTQLSIPTHAQLHRHRLKFIKNHLKKTPTCFGLRPSSGSYNVLAKITIIITTVGCFYAKSGDVAACRVVCIGLYLKSA